MMMEHSFKVKEVSRGRVIFLEGDPGHEAYIIQNGEVEIYAASGDEDTVFCVLKRGALFGEMALITNRVRVASARTRTDCELVIVPRDWLERQLQQYSPMVRSIVNGLVERLRQTNEKVVDVVTALEKAAGRKLAPKI